MEVTHVIMAAGWGYSDTSHSQRLHACDKLVLVL